MKRVRDADVEDSPRQNETAASRRRSSEPANGAVGASDIQDDDNNPSHRREIRSKYRDLINSVQQNREDMLNASNNRLTEVLEEANRLFKDVRQAREAALDAQLLVVATDLGKEKANQLFSEGIAFDTSAFAEHLLSFMGLNRLEDGEEEQHDGGGNGYLPQDAWQRVARRAERCFLMAPSFHYMNGAFHAEPPAPRQRIERQRKAPNSEAKRIMPTQLKKMEESHQEETEKEVERILRYLKDYHEDDGTPVSYFEFVIDPNSFSRTVENIFHTSFLIRDGFARIYLDEELPCIAPVEETEEEAGGPCSRKQCIISISPRSWKELIDAFEIREPLIPPPKTQDE
ncbi:non-structural maintenance of chromosomes element 4 homolog A [Thalassophryne amazonica]|uniref:non-structural maintenance of chromosomes element 4 homolog A n=1 Tax=Thalassophryne amazonica TaxID=390379 RepID=UPI0014709DC8|nr:non-structural maintenance of chromosomes element 4 homolog A [Thalassophryne amazonica]XP_034041399.1 non-structural maintenance of chromosomes element 4 homolog A [Thalassophryne amazonica]